MFKMLVKATCCAASIVLLYAPFGYAAGQILAEAVIATKSLDHDKIAKYIHSTTFKTVAGEIAYTGMGTGHIQESFFWEENWTSPDRA
jgi:hypothetical protein